MVCSVMVEFFCIQYDVMLSGLGIGGLRGVYIRFSRLWFYLAPSSFASLSAS